MDTKGTRRSQFVTHSDPHSKFVSHSRVVLKVEDESINNARPPISPSPISVKVEDDQIDPQIQPPSSTPTIRQWVIDTSSPHHVATFADHFIRFNAMKEIQLNLPNSNSTLKCCGIGDMRVIDGDFSNGKHSSKGSLIDVLLTDVLYCPGYPSNILSTAQLMQNGLTISMTNRDCKITDEKGSVVIHGFWQSSVYIADLASVVGVSKIQTSKTDSQRRSEIIKDVKQEDGEICSVPPKEDMQPPPMERSNPETINRAKQIPLNADNPFAIHDPSDHQAYLWHNRLGHLTFLQVCEMRRISLPVNPFCQTCAISKSAVETVFPKNVGRMTKRPLQLIYSDICCPAEKDKLDNKYFISFTDDYTRMSYIYLMQSRCEALEKFRDYKAAAEQLHKLPLVELRYDSAKWTYTSQEFTDYCNFSGVKLTPVPTNSLKGVAERFNRIIHDKARSMLTWAQLPYNYWGLAVLAANYVKNRSRTKPVGVAPHSLWYGNEPAIDHLRVWGCFVQFLVCDGGGKRQGARFHEGVFIGYTCSESLYKVFDFTANRTFIAKHVRFFEGTPAGLRINSRPSRSIFVSTEHSGGGCGLQECQTFPDCSSRSREGNRNRPAPPSLMWDREGYSQAAESRPPQRRPAPEPAGNLLRCGKRVVRLITLKSSVDENSYENEDLLRAGRIGGRNQRIVANPSRSRSPVGVGRREKRFDVVDLTAD